MKRIQIIKFNKSPYTILFLVFLSLSLGMLTAKAEKKVILEEISGKDTLGIMSNEFSIPELKIQPSPSEMKSISFPISEKITDYDVSPSGITVAAIVVKSEGQAKIKFWQIGEANIKDSCILPLGFIAKSITWHPNAKALFLIGTLGPTYQICRIERKNNQLTCRTIFSSTNRLRRLVICPRPYIIQSDYEKDEYHYAYRLFFGIDDGDKNYHIVSVTETGNRFYQVIGPAKTKSKAEDYGAGENPSNIVANWALPIAFHPGGHELIWEDNANSFFVARYNSKFWEESKPLNIAMENKGTITPTPNGLAFIHWQKEKTGIGVYHISSQKEERQLEDFQFISTPSSVPDGKGVVGLTLTDGYYSLTYHPINMPLPDVVNAWMFANSTEEINHLQKDKGLFRPNQYDHLYKLYESENYYCNQYDRTSPTRPYLVTTDIFWELFGAAYQGLFIIKERDEAMINFWMFISKADLYLKKEQVHSSWLQVFDVLNRFHSGDKSNKEVMNIRNERDCNSDITGKEYSFSDLKPRGHYISSSATADYFKAFRYFSTIFKGEEDKLGELNQLPQNITDYAIKWIKAYSGFISPSRSPLIWNDLKQNAPVYCKYPLKETTLFPLSWGFDNEVLYSTIYHNNFPDKFQVKGPNGVRLIPSGIDLAAALGNNFAENLLLSDYLNYPPLRKVIDNLKKNYADNKNNEGENLYDQWINAIAVQWENPLLPIDKETNDSIWLAKRLQTGLATWTTLRHATILVNERGAAECGEGGFEEILMRAPRGYVEPDPKTFAAIASLFEKAISYVSSTITDKEDFTVDDKQEKQSLYDGIIFRLKVAANEAHQFQSMAEKEIKGEFLTNDENIKILYVARTAEHLFLIFNSLANKDYALSDPEPMAKIADIAGDGKISPYLMAAVGNSMEWDYIVPYFGRREIVKGSIYSYYEFHSDELLNDDQWREKTINQNILPWIKSYVTYKSASEKPNTSY